MLYRDRTSVLDIDNNDDASALGQPPSTARAAVVFVDHCSQWHSFQQVAAVVRRLGYRTIRVTTAPTGPMTRALDKLLYDDTLYLGGEPDWEALAELLGSITVAEMYATEATLAAMPDFVYDALPRAVARDLRVRRTFSDKTRAAILARKQGVRIPEQVPGSVPPHEVTRSLGLPVVLKNKTGAAGAGVRIVHTPAEVETIAATFEDPGDFYFERFIAGDLMSYAAMVDADGTVQELTYRGAAPPLHPTGSPTAYEVVEDRALLTLGRAMSEGIGISGAVNVQAIRDHAGNHWMIDLNLRPFGGMLSYDQSQFDTATGYLYSVGLTEDPPVHATAPPGLQVSVFPMDAEELALTGRYWAAMRHFARTAPTFRDVFGVRYLVFAMFSGAAFKLDNLIRRKSRKGRRPDGTDQPRDEPTTSVRVRRGDE